jgi:cholesterol oxidase
MTEEGLEFTPEVIKMKNEPLGITFRETMAGSFSLGAEDPIEGKKAGEQSNTTLSMHASITIRDLDGFIADHEHLGEITGRIDFTPWGNDISAKTGVFNLFSPTDKPDTKYMVYEMGIEIDGTDYYLAGHKDVHNDPGFDLWTDTTTLFTTLYQSADKSGPIVGAGVLSLGVADLARLASTTRVTGEGSAFEKSEALSKFGVFFAGELWDLYGKRYQGFAGMLRKLFNRLMGRSK